LLRQGDSCSPADVLQQGPLQAYVPWAESGDRGQDGGCYPLDIESWTLARERNVAIVWRGYLGGVGWLIIVTNITVANIIVIRVIQLSSMSRFATGVAVDWQTRTQRTDFQGLIILKV
jgi:hypothetical protein